MKQVGSKRWSRLGRWGAGSEFHSVDVTDSAQVKTLIDDTLARHGTLDILVNGAAYQTETGPVADVTEEEWDSGLGLFLKGPFLGCKYAIPAMLKGGGGAIINISSAVVLRGSTFSLPYSVAKAGIVQLTKTTSSQYCERGIRVNCIVPRRDRHPRLPTRVPFPGHRCEVRGWHTRGPDGCARGRGQARPLPRLRRRCIRGRSQFSNRRRVQFSMIEEPRLIEVTAEGLAVQWDEEHRSVYPFKSLREQCKCANCIDEWSGRRILDPDSVSSDIEILDFIEIGRYAVQLLWSDAPRNRDLLFRAPQITLRLQAVQDRPVNRLT